MATSGAFFSLSGLLDKLRMGGIGYEVYYWHKDEGSGGYGALW